MKRRELLAAAAGLTGMGLAVGSGPDRARLWTVGGVDQAAFSADSD